MTIVYGIKLYAPDWSANVSSILFLNVLHLSENCSINSNATCYDSYALISY